MRKKKLANAVDVPALKTQMVPYEYREELEDGSVIQVKGWRRCRTKKELSDHLRDLAKKRKVSKGVEVYGRYKEPL